ncbi:heme ABC transporter ATP-binding protein [Aureimonas sp. ME7]|uniref:heme ABC transporter ATP-binding protein n=1 Tax=Aureimonas sp. ME7 TaxID=2744252 RepID=UPI0015F6F76C|nr:heme ABC transporter ATP-binding protein [Aureimonas sp. ME7]
MIELVEAGFGYPHRPVIEAVSLGVEPGALTVIVGPNGAGKSTLLKLMTGEMRPERGTVRWAGEDLHTLHPAILARRRAVLPQGSGLAFPFTVAEVVRLGLEAGGRAREGGAIGAALAEVDLAGFSARLYGELSGGEQQRVHLARVLCQIGEPVSPDGSARFLFLDEPVSSLDIRHQLGVLRIARRFAGGGGGVVAVLHDLNLAAGFADRMIAVAGGRIAADGPPGRVMRDETIRRVFGVSLRVGVVPPPSVPFVLPQTAIEP